MAGSEKSVGQRTAEAYKAQGTELARRYLRDSSTETLEELVNYCQERIRAIVRYLVIGRGYFLPGEDANEYIKDACQDVTVKVLENIGSLKEPEHLSWWLKEISFHVIVDAYRRAVGRGPEKRTGVGSETRDDDGEPTSIFETQYVRDAAALHLGRSLTESAEADHWTERIHNRAVLEKALAIHATSGKERDFESSLWVKETWDYPELTAEQIAKLRNRSVGDTHHILHHDNKVMMPIVRYLVDPVAAENAWGALIKDIGAALGEDPTGPNARVLANRWEDLGGDVEVMEDLRKQHAERATNPVPLVLSNEIRTFISGAVEANKKGRNKNQKHALAS